MSTLEIPEEPEQTLKRPSPWRESWLSRDSNDRLDDICLKKRKREEKLKPKKKKNYLKCSIHVTLVRFGPGRVALVRLWKLCSFYAGGGRKRARVNNRADGDVEDIGNDSTAAAESIRSGIDNVFSL